ncbi:hypothetical protein WJX72_009711 [[Myrmecia] bisecta]|uniref:NADH-ubiquinone oxidoreductase 75 kDa subunit, mitochondrial n=1 Tax=[Myrmecia] bisecta TaxID=41462 RepID=A0AAW1QT82_9CHLO
MAACDAAGIDIPRFCYHQRLSIAGNCRMCLVEVEKSPKPVASCAMPAGPGMKIKTDTPLVKKAREGVMEFLLINHPLDCPICDQGGECDLQDQAMHFGSDRGRFTEMKRAVDDKNLGPLVKTVMTRCIHCTRCVRFATEIAGVQDMGITGRGRDSEVGTYVDKLLTSELSGNVIDLCPVGALTSKPFAFTARNWELKNTESVDVSDALGANIRIDSRGAEVMRIVPRLNEDVNEEWISDKARFQYDGLKRQRLSVPLVKGKDGGFRNAHWSEALLAIQQALKGVKGNEIKAIAGKLSDAEAMIALKDLMNRLGSGNLQHEAGFSDLDADVRSNYLMNTGISGIEKADAVLLIGSNPRLESPVFNARIRKMWLEGVSVYLIGFQVDLTYAYTYLGNSPEALTKVLKNSDALKRLKEAKRPAVIVGPGVLKRSDRDAVLQQVHGLVEKAEVVKEGWNGYNVLHDAASRVAALDIGFLPSARASAAPPAKFVYLLGSDDWQESDIPEGAFVVYQGHHGDRGASRADVILPAAAYTEKSATFVNTEGRAQRTKEAVPKPGDSREDWQILVALAEVLKQPLPYKTLNAVRERLAEVAPHLQHVDEREAPIWLNGEYFKAFASKAGKAAASNKEFRSSIDNFYMTDVISRSSQVMAKCVQAKGSMRQGSYAS